MTYQDHIVSDPSICGGQPVIRGTRVLVRTILGYLAHGEPVEVILREFPSLAEADVRAVIALAGWFSHPDATTWRQCFVVATPNKLRVLRPASEPSGTP